MTKQACVLALGCLKLLFSFTAQDNPSHLILTLLSLKSLDTAAGWMHNFTWGSPGYKGKPPSDGVVRAILVSLYNTLARMSAEWHAYGPTERKLLVESSVPDFFAKKLGKPVFWLQPAVVPVTCTLASLAAVSCVADMHIRVLELGYLLHSIQHTLRFWYIALAYIV